MRNNLDANNGFHDLDDFDICHENNFFKLVFDGSDYLIYFYVEIDDEIANERFINVTSYEIVAQKTFKYITDFIVANSDTFRHEAFWENKSKPYDFFHINSNDITRLKEQVDNFIQKLLYSINESEEWISDSELQWIRWEIWKKFDKAIVSTDLQLKFKNPEYLPTLQEIKNAFISHTQWRGFMKNSRDIDAIFEFWNEDYLNELSNYLIERSLKYKWNSQAPLTVLEVGAGNWKLSHFLRQKLSETNIDNIDVIATDSNDWGLKQCFPVDVMNIDDACDKYSPDIVIYSWMPLREDYLEGVRKTNTLKEYILIGEADGGSCWHKWKTWWVDENWAHEWQMKPYEKDGFGRYDLPLSDLQVCRSDEYNNFSRSCTVSFRRK